MLKSNNAVEIWHHWLVGWLVGWFKCKISTFIKCIHEKHSLKEGHINQVLIGQVPMQQRKKYTSAAVCIKNITAEVEKHHRLLKKN